MEDSLFNSPELNEVYNQVYVSLSNARNEISKIDHDIRRLESYLNDQCVEEVEVFCFEEKDEIYYLIFEHYLIEDILSKDKRISLLIHTTTKLRIKKSLIDCKNSTKKSMYKYLPLLLKEAALKVKGE